MNSNRKIEIGSRVWILFLLCIVASTPSLRAQSAGNTGQIVGLVVDPTLASVAGAEVTARNKNTNFV
jgi:hypothetical protein